MANKYAANESTTSVAGRKVGRLSYGSLKLHAKRDRKRQEAEARQREHDALSVKDKITLAKSRDGESKREIARLKAALKTEKN